MDSIEPETHPDRVSEWHAEYAARLTAFAWGVLRNRALAEEAVQTAFAQALVHADSIQPGAEKAWLYQVTYREALVIRRRQSTERRANQASALREENPFGATDFLLQQEQVARVQAALQALPESQRQVVVQRIYEGQTFEQIARRFQLPLGTVLTRMRSALQKLRQSLKNDL